MKKTGLTAVGLRGILVTLIVLLIGLSGAGFYFAQKWLTEFSKTVSQTIANSSTSGHDVQSLKQLQEDLAAKQDIITKATNIATTTDNFQTQSIQDLGTYADLSGVKITNYSFPPATQAAGTAAKSATSITLTLQSPMSYVSLLKFMNYIENNLPKMQISTITLSRVEGNSTSVRAESMTVEVYTR